LTGRSIWRPVFLKAEMSTQDLQHIVIVGGGSAGWLTAGVIAAEHAAAPGARLRVTLLESPDVAPIGVGEGAWPSMRDTLARVGVSETVFVRECDASFKQGSRFNRWIDGGRCSGRPAQQPRTD
jgi:tryptophan halogenase